MGLTPRDLLHPRWSFTRGELEERQAGALAQWKDQQYLIAKLGYWVRSAWVGRKAETPEQLLGWPKNWAKKRR